LPDILTGSAYFIPEVPYCLLLIEKNLQQSIIAIDLEPEVHLNLESHARLIMLTSCAEIGNKYF
jgi:hypothetical protein